MRPTQTNIEVGFIEFDTTSKFYWQNDPESFRVYARRCAHKASLKQTDVFDFKTNETLDNIDPSQYSFSSISSSQQNHPHLYKKSGNVGRSPALLPGVVGQGGFL
jgi:hypothetical protein